MAVGMALLLALSVVAPTVAAAETTVTVQTDPATEVTDQSATLNGNPTELSGADNATVYFEYWVEGDRANSTNTSDMTVGETGAFSWSATGLSNNTTYVYVAHAEANGTTAVGAERTFTTLAEAPLGVDTLDASDVTNSSATLNGELTGLGGADSANVSFEYWIEGDRANSTTVGQAELDAPGTFNASVSGLSNNTTYVYVAHAEANGSNVTGDQVTFTPGVTDSDEEDGPFGQRVAAFVHDLLDSGDYDGNIGQAVSEFVTENNPGADNRPDDAGPPEDRGDDEDGDEQGPPEDRDDDEDGDEQGPPEDAGPPEDRDDDEDDEESDS